MSYSDDYVSVDLAITFVILDTLNIFFLIDWSRNIFDESAHLFYMAIKKKFNTEGVNDYPPIQFEIRFERKFPIVGLYFLTLPVETLWNLCPVEKLFGMRMAGLCQFYWRTCFNLYLLF